MVSQLRTIQTVVVQAQGPPGAGLTLAEKTDILDDITALEADVASLGVDMTDAQGDIVTLQTDLTAAKQGWATFIISGGGSVIPTGVQFRALIPTNYTVSLDPVDGQAWRVGLDQSGSVSLDLWMGTHAAYPPTSANRISGTVGTNNPRVTSATAAQSSSLTNWTTALVGGRWLFINVSSVTTATWASLGLYLVKA